VGFVGTRKLFLVHQIILMPLIAFLLRIEVMLIAGKPMIEWLRRKSWRKRSAERTWDVPRRYARYASQEKRALRQWAASAIIG
jgi:hypothetical protein